MRRNQVIALNRRRILGPTVSNYPYSYFCATFHGVISQKEEEKPILLHKLRFDFSGINELDDAVRMFREMVRVRPKPSVFEFNKLLIVVGKMKHYYAALLMFDEMRQLGVLDYFTMNIVINCYCHLNRVDFGFSIFGCLFKLGHEPNIITFNTLIKGFFLADKAFHALEIFKKLLREKPCEPDEVTFLAVINGLCKAGHTLMARDFLGMLAKGTCKPHVRSYNKIIDSLSKDKMVDDTLQLLNQIQMIEKKFSPNVVTYNSVIQGLCNFGRWKEVKDLFTDMQGLKIYPDLITFNILVNAFCKEGMMDEAEDMLKSMKKRNISPDIVTYTTLIDGYCLQGRIDKARRLFDSLPLMCLKPGIVSYNIMLNGYIKKGKVDEALNFFHEISSNGLEPSIVSYNIMLQGLFCRGRYDAGQKLFNDMEALKVYPDIFTYSVMLRSLCKTRQFTQAFLFLQTMEDKGLNPDKVIYSIMIDGLCKGGKPDVARILFNQLHSKGLKPNVVIYNIVIGSLCLEGRVQEAKDMLIYMEKVGCAPNSVTFNVFVQNLLKRKELNEAMQLLEEMVRRGFSGDSTTVSMLFRKFEECRDSVLLDMIQRLVPRKRIVL